MNWEWKVEGWVHGNWVAKGTTKYRWQARRAASREVRAWPRVAVIDGGPAAICPRPSVTIQSRQEAEG